MTAGNLQENNIEVMQVFSTEFNIAQQFADINVIAYFP